MIKQIDNFRNWRKYLKTVSSKVSRNISFLKRGKKILKTRYTGITESYIAIF